MKTRFEIWERKIDALAEVVGYEKAWSESDRMTDNMLGITKLDDDVEEEAKLLEELLSLQTEEVLERLSEEDFSALIDALEYAVELELELIENAKKDREEEEARIEKIIWKQENPELDLTIYERERELCFEYDLSKRQAQVVARREAGMTNDEIAEEFGISKQSASDAYRIGIQKLSIMQNDVEKNNIN